MEITRAIIIAIGIWILGVAVYSVSFYVPLMEDLELQSNMALALSLLPLGWFGSKYYYQKGGQWHGLLLASVMLTVAILLDAMITVPLMIIPLGGSYSDFFGAASFWMIGLVYFLVVLIYWKLNIKSADFESMSQS